MKTITIAGNIGKDAEVRKAQDGTPVAGFTVAVEDRSQRDAQPYWFDVSIWGKRGESLAQYIRKGGKVVVTGDLLRREHNGNTYLSVRADNVTLMGGKQGSGPRDSYQEHDAPQQGHSSGLDDEIPF